MNNSDEVGATQAKSRLAYLWTTLTVLACPCHIPILIAVLSGTAFGAFLSEYFAVAFLVLVVLFLVFAASALKAWSGLEEVRR